MFKAVYSLKEIGSFETFKEAFKALYDIVQAELGKVTLSWQILEAATWIENTSQMINLPVLFFDARDIACDKGWLVNGKWQEENENDRK